MDSGRIRSPPIAFIGIAHRHGFGEVHMNLVLREWNGDAGGREASADVVPQVAGDSAGSDRTVQLDPVDQDDGQCAVAEVLEKHFRSGIYQDVGV